MKNLLFNQDKKLLDTASLAFNYNDVSVWLVNKQHPLFLSNKEKIQQNNYLK